MPAPDSLSIDDMIRQTKIASRYTQADLEKMEIEENYETHVAYHRARLRDANLRLMSAFEELGEALVETRDAYQALENAEEERDTKMDAAFEDENHRAMADVLLMDSIPDADLHDHAGDVLGYIIDFKKATPIVVSQ